MEVPKSPRSGEKSNAKVIEAPRLFSPSDAMEIISTEATWLSEIHFRCVMAERTRDWSEGIASPLSKWYPLYLGKPTERDGRFVIQGNEIRAVRDRRFDWRGQWRPRKNWCAPTSIIIIRREWNIAPDRGRAKKEKLIFNTRDRGNHLAWFSRSLFRARYGERKLASLFPPYEHSNC